MYRRNSRFPILRPVAILLAAASLLAQDPRLSPFLTKYCANCHNAKSKTANLDLSTAAQPVAVWEKVLDKLETKRMPPPGLPQPSREELAAVTAIIERTPGRDPRSAAQPGRITSRRLNKVEYNNTVRDLLAVSLRPADEFPTDDAGYGFDTVGDVQTVSPLLMEKYLSAARQLSHAAIYGESTPPKPTKLARFMTKKSQDDPTPGALPFSNRGAIYGSFNFPVTGDYEFRMRVGNYRPRTPLNDRHRELMRKRSVTPAEKQELDALSQQAYPPVKMVMTMDGKQIYTETVEGNIDFQYAHGESIARVHATAGEHHFRAAFPEFANLANPLDNMNTDGRRKLFIDYVDVVGPFTPANEKPASYRQIFICEEHTQTCAERIINRLAHRAFRRPVTKDELDSLTGLAAMVRRQEDTFEEGIRVALQAILLSPNFLFRAEPITTDARPISDHDLASRLSYFLWSSMPDDELLTLADAGKLRQPGVLQAQVKRMLADPKSNALVENFAGQWLGLRQMNRRKPDPARFPRVDDELLDAMRLETELFTRAVLQEDRSILDFIDAPFTFVNGPLARHYGIPGVDGEAMQRVKLNGPQRGGVLTHGSVLTQSSYATRTSPVLRGRWVLETLLGTPPPPPPPDVPALPEAAAGAAATVRARLEQHRANPACAVCHDLMDPIGFGLENFDAAGVWRDGDGGQPIDSSGVFPGGAKFNGPDELRRAMRAQSSLFVRNFIEKLMTYALGRGLEPADRPVVEDITARLAANGHRMTVLVNAIIESKPFQMRGKTEGIKHASR